MFAKALFRSTTSRLAPRQSVRNVTKVMSQQSSLFAMSQAHSRMFTTYAGIERGIQKLNKALEKEIKYENENYTQLEDIETFLNESGFRFSEEDNGIVMKLTKTVGEKTVEVEFEARQVLDLFSHSLW